MEVKEIVYLNRDNTVDLLLKANGVAQDLTASTRMILKDIGGKFTIDSQISAGAFNWNPGITGKLILDLGGETLPAGMHDVRLIVYDPSNTDGIVWGDFKLAVIQN